MATISKTFNFASNNEGFGGSSGSFTWDSSHGAPANGCLKYNGTAHSGYFLWSGTWEDLGVPSNSTVSSISFQSAQFNMWQAGLEEQNYAGPMYLTSYNGGSNIGKLWNGEFSDGTLTDGFGTVSGLTVSVSNLPSSGQIGLKLSGMSSATCGWYFDTPTFSINYSPSTNYTGRVSIALHPVLQSDGSEKNILPFAYHKDGLQFLSQGQYITTNTLDLEDYQSDGLVGLFLCDDGGSYLQNKVDGKSYKVEGLVDTVSSESIAYATKFNGQTTYLQLPDDLFQYASSSVSTYQRTIILKFKTNSAGTLISQIGLGSAVNSSVAGGTIPYASIGFDGKLYIWNGSTVVTPFNNEVFNDNEWHTLSIRLAYEKQVIDIDNRLRSTLSYTFNQYNISYSFLLGTGYSGGYSTNYGNGGWFFFNGAMSDIRIYDKFINDRLLSLITSNNRRLDILRTSEGHGVPFLTPAIIPGNGKIQLSHPTLIAKGKYFSPGVSTRTGSIPLFIATINPNNKSLNLFLKNQPPVAGTVIKTGQYNQPKHPNLYVKGSTGAHLLKNTSLFVQGLENVKSTTLYIKGKNLDINKSLNLTLFAPAIGNVSHLAREPKLNLFTKGHIPGLTKISTGYGIFSSPIPSLPLLITGLSGYTSSNKADLYVKGFVNTYNKSLNLYIEQHFGTKSVNLSMKALPAGISDLNKTSTLFLKGHQKLNSLTSPQLPLVVYMGTLAGSNIPLYINGPVKVSNTRTLHINGPIKSLNDLNLFLKVGLPQTQHLDFPAYIHGKSSVNNNAAAIKSAHLFMEADPEFYSSLNLFVGGKSASGISKNNLNLVLKSLFDQNKTTTLFLKNEQEIVDNNLRLYIRGLGKNPGYKYSDSDVNMFIGGTGTGSLMTPIFSGKTASLFMGGTSNLYADYYGITPLILQVASNLSLNSNITIYVSGANPPTINSNITLVIYKTNMVKKAPLYIHGF